MKYTETIAELRRRAKILLECADQLESINGPGLIVDVRPRKRGRKGMGMKERAEVSARMKRYWARRRNARAGAGG